MEDIDHPCSLREEDDDQYQDIDRCSSNNACYGDSTYRNSECNARESCGKYKVAFPAPMNDGSGRMTEVYKKQSGCILSKYCPEQVTYDPDVMVKNKFLGKKVISLECPQGKKEDSSRQEQKAYAEKVERFVAKNAQDNGLYIARKNYKCADPGENLGVFITGQNGPLGLVYGANYAAPCAVEAKKFEAGNKGKCKFFMYSYYRPTEGCQCCSSAERVEPDEEWDVYQTSSESNPRGGSGGGSSSGNLAKILSRRGGADQYLKEKPI